MYLLYGFSQLYYPVKYNDYSNNSQWMVMNGSRKPKMKGIMNRMTNTTTGTKGKSKIPENT